jgi:hypothetical protein
MMHGLFEDRWVGRSRDSERRLFQFADIPHDENPLPRRRRRRIVHFLTAVLLILVGTTVACAADEMSIAQLVAQRSKWPDFAASGQPIKIDGRYSIFSSKLLRFLKCDDLNFVWHDDEQTFPVDLPTLRSRTIEVYGRFVLQSGKPLFRVERVRELPTDAETFSQRKSALTDAPAAAWYALGDWALARGSFYSDLELEAEAQRLFAEAIKREGSALADEALDAKIALSQKFGKYELGDADRVAFVHDAFSRRWRAMKTNVAAVDLEQLSDRMREYLRGCRTPLDSPQTALADRYRLDPGIVYRESGSATRQRLNRILYSEIRFAYVQALGREKNLDGLQLADAIDREVPEFHAKAEKLREQTLQERLAAAATLSRSDVLKLAERFALREQPEKALQAKKAWVLAGDERLRKEGRPDDLIQAAHEHQSLLDDNEGAAKLLMEAYDRAPEMKEISEQLERLGWKRAGGKWLTRAEAAALPPDPAKQAADEGPRVGMTREQILKVLSSRPDSVTRVISAGRLNEVWIYNENVGPRLAVHFLGSVDAHDLRVVKLVQ